MPLKYPQLISPEMQAQYAYQKAKLTKALERTDSLEFEMLYRLVAREMAQVHPALIIPYVELCISPQCTLRCRDCANFMQHYNKPQPMDLEQVWSWVTAFLESVDHVMTFRVMGGEPLMQKQLPELMQRLLAQPKLQHIQVVSNATLMPKDELLNLMSNNHRCSMFFSNYGPKVAPRYQEIVKHCQEHHVLVETLCPDISWFDMGDCSDRHLTPEQMAATYQRCPNNCRHIWNGEFHHCPRSAHAKYLGLIKDIPEQDYVPLLALDAETRRARIRKMYDADYIKACNHCGFATGFHLIPCAIQAEKPSRRGPHAGANAADANAADASATVTGTLEQGNQAEQSAQVSSPNTPSMGLVDTSATALNLNSSVDISALTTPTSAATSTASTASAVASAAPAAAPAAVAGMKQVGTVGGLKVYAQRHANNHKKSKKKRR